LPPPSARTKASEANNRTTTNRERVMGVSFGGMTSVGSNRRDSIPRFAASLADLRRDSSPSVSEGLRLALADARARTLQESEVAHDYNHSRGSLMTPVRALAATVSGLAR